MSGRQRLGVILVVCLVSLLPSIVLANGGQVRISNERVGAYDVTISTSPTPLREGIVDVNALVKDPDTGEFVHDARIWITAEPLDGSSAPSRYEATQAQATLPNYYAVEFELPTKGKWHFTVQVEGGGSVGETAFEADVAGESLIESASWLIWIFAIILGGGALWWLFGARGDDEDLEDDLLTPTDADTPTS